MECQRSIVMADQSTPFIFCQSIERKEKQNQLCFVLFFSGEEKGETFLV
jgi:hypothetical protein